MKLSHTPGPWETGRNMHGFDSTYSGPTIYSADHLMIAETLGGMPDEQVAANARLIAAAPDLLSALREIAAFDPHPTAQAVALRAIAKAEGRS
jgi:hypothetical protein